MSSCIAGRLRLSPPRESRIKVWLESTPQSVARWQWLSLLCLALILYTFRLGSARTLTDHEVYVGAPAKQMADCGDWLAPRMGHALWLEKPPLAHWLANLSSLLWGRFDETSVRLPSALAGVGVVLLTAWIMARLFSPTIGYLAGLLQTTSVFMLQTARQAVADMQLALLVLAAIAVFVHLHFCGGFQHRNARRFVWLFWLLIGLTNLSKGPLFGAALVLFTCGGWLLGTRKWSDLRQLVSPAGLITAVAIGSAWPLLVGLNYPEAWDLWQQHLFGRFSGTALQYNHRPFWFYGPSAAWQWLPWTPLVLLGCGRAWREAYSSPGSPHRFLAWWFLGQVGLLSCGAGKGHYYLIYALPALAPLAALGLLRVGGWIAAGVAAMQHLGWGTVVLAPLAAAAAPWAVSRWLTAPPTGLFVLVSFVSVLASVGGVAIVRGHARWSLMASYLAIFALELYTVGWVMPYRDPSAADREFFRDVDRRLAAGDLLLGADFIGMPRYIFYLNHPVEGFLMPEDIPLLPQQRDSAYVLARAKQGEQLRRLGHLEIVSQSKHTRSEDGPQDRYTLFHIKRVSYEEPRHD